MFVVSTKLRVKLTIKLTHLYNNCFYFVCILSFIQPNLLNTDSLYLSSLKSEPCTHIMGIFLFLHFFFFCNIASTNGCFILIARKLIFVISINSLFMASLYFPVHTLIISLISSFFFIFSWHYFLLSSYLNCHYDCKYI